MHGIPRCFTFGLSRGLGGLSSGGFAGFFLAAVLFGGSASGVAQTSGSAGDVSVTTVFPSNEIAEIETPALFANAVAEEDLPEAPAPQQKNDPQQPLVTAGSKTTVPANTNMPVAPMFSRIIPAGEATPQIHKWDKIQLAARNLYSFTSFASFFFSAGWSHLTNGQGNYGTNSGAFGQRLGAATIRDSSQAFLANGPLAVWLHQDPRYFAMGPGHSFGRRTWYALMRPLITRDSTDGHSVFNSSGILGLAAGTALNNLYYPKSNRNFHDNIASFGGSMGGSALSFAMDEYMSEILKAIHLRRAQRFLH